MKKNILIVSVFVIVIVMLFGYKFYKHERWQSIQLASIVNGVNDEKQKINDYEDAIKELQIDVSGSGAYSKIKHGLPVNILIVGDSIGAGAGATDYQHAWPSIVKDYIESEYNSEVSMNNISMGGESSIAGYTRLSELKDDVCYDLIFVCFGQNDAEKDFEIYYESIIRSVLRKYPDCSIISIQEHSQKTYTNKMNSILRVANYYQIPVVDTIQAFQEFEDGYDALVVDGVHPNDLGYEIFAREVEKVLDSEIKRKSLPIGKKDKTKNTQTDFFDNSIWVGIDKFERNDLVYSIDISKDIIGNGEKNFLSDGIGVMMVIDIIDIIDLPGQNNLFVINNGEKIAEREKKWDYSFGQRHIPIIDNNIVIKAGKLSIEFTSVEQADSFQGCGFILGK